MTPVYEGVPGLAVELDGNVLRLRLDQPDKRNAVSDEMTVSYTHLTLPTILRV